MEFERDECVIYCFSYSYIVYFLYFYFLGVVVWNYHTLFIVSPISLNVSMLKLKCNIYP